MKVKCKNPYYDHNIDRKFVYLLNSFLIDRYIFMQEKVAGLFIKNNSVGILDTDTDYKMSTYKEVSVYEAFSRCIPDGMRYNKELDKLVPDVIEDKKSVADMYTIGIDLSNDLQDILESDMKYGDKIRAIRNTKNKHTGGDGNKWYDLPEGANQLQDLIEHKNMNGNIKDVFKACYRVGKKDGTEEVYDVEKMAYYSLRELGRILNTKDYIFLATKLMGKQNTKDNKNAK